MRWSVLLCMLGMLAGCVSASRQGPGASPHREPELLSSTPKHHRVGEGETLYSIARTYGVTPEALAEENRILNPKALRAGDLLTLPRGTRAVSGGPVVSASGTSTSSSGVVPRRERDDGGWGGAGSAGRPSATAAAAVAAASQSGGAPASAPASGTVGGAIAAASQSGGADRSRAGDGRRPTPDARPPARDALPDKRSHAFSDAKPSGERIEVRGGNTGGTLDWPVRGVLYARFGRKGREPHDGIDLAAPLGTPIQTARPGKVLFAGEQKAYGLIAIVDHGNDLITLYAHCHDLRVKTGQTVRQGQVVATVGESGRTSGPHLHFEVRKNGRPTDPLTYLQAPKRPGVAARRGAR